MSEYPSGVAVYEFPKETCGNGHPGKYVDLRAYTALAERLSESGSSHSVIVKTSGVCGGEPRINNTRITVRIVNQFYDQGATVDEIADMYELPAWKVSQALDYPLVNNVDSKKEKWR